MQGNSLIYIYCVCVSISSGTLCLCLRQPRQDSNCDNFLSAASIATTDDFALESCEAVAARSCEIRLSASSFDLGGQQPPGQKSDQPVQPHFSTQKREKWQNVKMSKCLKSRGPEIELLPGQDKPGKMLG